MPPKAPKRAYSTGRWCAIINCPFKVSNAVNDGERKFVLWPTKESVQKQWSKKVGANFRRERKTLMICSLHFDLEDPENQLIRLTRSEESKIAERWNAGGSFHGRLFTVPDEVLPTRYVNKVENDTIAVELETGLETEDVLEQMADQQNDTYISVDGERIELPDISADDDATSPAFQARMKRLEEGRQGVESHCAIKSCPFNENFWHINSHFSYPLDPGLRKKWADACGEYEKGSSRDDHLLAICNHHFTPNAFFTEDFLRSRGYGRLGKKVIKPCAYPTLYIIPEVNNVLRQRWHRQKLASKLTGSTSLQEYMKLAKGTPQRLRAGMRQLDDTEGNAKLSEWREELAEGALERDFSVDNHIPAVELEDCMWRSGIRGTILRHLPDKLPNRPRMYTKSEKIARNASRIQWMQNRVSELEEICLKQKMVIASNYAAIGSGNSI